MAALAFACGPAPASAHALLVQMTPAAGTVSAVETPPRQVSLWFSEPVEVAFNAVAVVDADGRRIDRLDAHVAADDPRRVDVGLGAVGDDLAQGAYLVRWRATSVDNHLVDGTFWFAVGFASSLPAAALSAAAAPIIAPFEVAARWLALLGLLALAGGPAFLLLVVRPVVTGLSADVRAVLVGAGQRLERVWLIGLVVFVVAHLAWAAAQAEALAEVGLPQALDWPVTHAVLLDSRFGALWWMRVLLGLSVCGLMLGATRRSGGLPSSRVLWLGAGLGVLLSLGVSLGGHAAAARWAAPLAVGVDVLHLMAAALWLGGLVVLTVLLPSIARADPGLRSGVLRALVPRTSRTAFASVLVLVASGVVSAWEESGSLEALAATAYGQTLLIKVGLLVPLLAIAAVNRFGIVRSLTSAGRPEDARLPRRLARLVGAEVGIGGAVLLAAATLTTLPPPGFQGVPGPVALARQAGDLRIALTVEPAWVGVSRFELTVTDAQGRPPSDVSDVILTFTMEGMNMGRTTVRATPRAPGVFQAEGFYIGMPGASLVGAAVSRAAAAEQSAVFRIEMPNVSQAQFQGLAPSLGLGRPDQGSATTLDEAGLARGQANYAAHCATCHGDTGLGNGPAAASLLPPPADLTLHARWHSDAQLLWFITNGVSGTPMPGFADQLGPTERAEIVAHLHALALAPTASLPREAPVAAAVPALVTPATSAGVSPALSGRLVFGPDTDKDFWIWQFPGETAERLTQFGRLDFASHPVWSPDGQRIAFSFYTLPRVGAIPPGTDVYLMDADGRNMRLAAAHDTQGAALLHPVWAPDGAALYATHQAHAAGGGTASRIERVDTVSGTLQTVVSNAAYPSPSHDGRLLAYVAMPNADGSAQSLWLSTADGHDSRQIVPTAAFVRLSSVQFAPDGQRILFAAVGQGAASGWPLSRVGHPLGLLGLLLGVRTAHANGEEWDLWTVEPDGRNLRRLTNIAEDLPIATWSPSGRQIAFLGGGSARTAETGLAVIDADGGNLRRLTTRPGHRGADWSPVP